LTAAELLATLEQRHVLLDIADDARLHVDAPRGAIDDDLARALRRYRDRLVWTVLGRRTGHIWLPCAICGETQLVRPEKAGRLCQLTAGCQGRLTRHAT
jgi:hypothetical protein